MGEKTLAEECREIAEAAAVIDERCRTLPGQSLTIAAEVHRQRASRILTYWPMPSTAGGVQGAQGGCGCPVGDPGPICDPGQQSTESLP
jgi:hypothetical protein